MARVWSSAPAESFRWDCNGATSWENLPWSIYANNKVADQTVHRRSLISVFVVRCLNRILPIVALSKLFTSLVHILTMSQENFGSLWPGMTQTSPLSPWPSLKIQNNQSKISSRWPCQRVICPKDAERQILKKWKWPYLLNWVEYIDRLLRKHWYYQDLAQEIVKCHFSSV